MAPDFSFLNMDALKTFALVLTRVTTLFVVLPFLSSSGIPSIIKVGLALMVSVAVFPSVPLVHIQDSGLAYSVAVTSEVLVGLLMGFATVLFFTIGQIAGGLVGLQMGLRMADLVDPFTSATVSLIGELYFFTMTLLLFATDGHLNLMRGLFDSFRIIPIAHLQFTPELGRHMIRLLTTVFNIGVQLASPVLFVAVIATVCQGLIGRTAPEINILMIGFPILIMIGFFMLYATMPLSFVLFKGSLHRMITDLYTLMRLMGSHA